MATVDLGKLKPVWKGTWAGSTSYEKDDMVQEGVNSYICTTAHTSDASTFSNDSANWDIMATGAALASQTGNSGKFLTTDGTDTSWDVVNVAGGFNIDEDNTADVTFTASTERFNNISFTSTGNAVILPDATTLSNGGLIFQIKNTGKVNFDIKNNGSTILYILEPSQSVDIYLKDNSTSNGEFQINNSFNQSVDGGVAYVADFREAFGIGENDGHRWRTMSFCKAGVNKIVQIGHRYDTTNDSTYTKIYAAAGEIASDGSITWGSKLQINQVNGSNNYLYNPSCGYLEDDKVVIIYNWYDGTNYKLLGDIVTLSGTTLSKGGTADIYAPGNAGWRDGGTILSATTGSFNWFGCSDGNTTGTVHCTYSGNTISVGGYTQLASNSNETYMMDESGWGLCCLSHNANNDYIVGYNSDASRLDRYQIGGVTNDSTPAALAKDANHTIDFRGDSYQANSSRGLMSISSGYIFNIVQSCYGYVQNHRIVMFKPHTSTGTSINYNGTGMKQLPPEMSPWYADDIAISDDVIVAFYEISQYVFRIVFATDSGLRFKTYEVNPTTHKVTCTDNKHVNSDKVNSGFFNPHQLYRIWQKAHVTDNGYLVVYSNGAGRGRNTWSGSASRVATIKV